MKPTDEQLLAIKQYLYKHLKYRETRDEMFDHIVTALEDVTEDASFGETMNGVIGNIGGLKGIAKIERAAKISAIKLLVKGYVEMLKQICTSWYIVVIASLTLVTFYLTNRFLFNHFGLYFPMLVMIGIPSTAIKRNILKKANLDHVKNDAFKTVYQVFGMITPGMMLLSVLILKFGSLNLFQSIITYITTLTFCMAITHASVLYKLTRREFRVIMSDI